jgi:catechol 1,2-dioxygenase
MVRSAAGEPLSGAMLDVWQISADMGYSHFHPGFPEYNLRGRLTTDAEGRFEVRTIVPPPYQVPTDGATGKLLAALGRSPFRPAHLHLKLTAEGHRPLTTQVFFEGDPWFGRDVVTGADKGSLVTRLERDGGETARCSFDFVLEPVAAAVPA